MAETMIKCHDLQIPNPLWGLLAACEIHCTARCCEDSAFEQDPKLIVKAIENPSGRADFEYARRQLLQVIEQTKNFESSDESDQILVWTPDKPNSFNFQLNLDTAGWWFAEWERVFERTQTVISSPVPE